MSISRRVRIIVFVFALACVIALAGALVWLGATAGELMPRARLAMQSDSQVTVSRGDWIEFAPVGGNPSRGFIFYPGGRVQPEAYAPMARAIAEAGYLAVITPMPLNLAILNIDAAGAVIEARPDIKGWVIGGHSLGGSVAVRYAHGDPDNISGLAIMAAYPEAEFDLSRRELAVATIYAEFDGLATVAEVEASFALLPADADKVLTAGGNHAQFGWYGEQSGDMPATISHEAQHEQVVAAVLRLLDASGG